ncbi:hypothetical protein MIR68_001927 [Amoeboaphelidium protococcarum]|nr:hypothetical protein MIR68_001927 [Amoeboaphelidium protococcarum]
MDSVWQRLNAVFSHGLTVAMVLVAAVSLLNPLFIRYSVSHQQQQQQQQGFDIQVRSVSLMHGKHDVGYFNAKSKEYLFLDVELNADLSAYLPSFADRNKGYAEKGGLDFLQSMTWNAKQLTISLVLSYSTKVLPVNEMVVWYKVINVNEMGYGREMDYIGDLFNSLSIPALKTTKYRKQNWTDQAVFNGEKLSNVRYSHWALPVCHLPLSDLLTPYAPSGANKKDPRYIALTSQQKAAVKADYEELKGLKNVSLELRWELGPQIGFMQEFTASSQSLSQSQLQQQQQQQQDQGASKGIVFIDVPTEYSTARTA